MVGGQGVIHILTGNAVFLCQLCIALAFQAGGGYVRFGVFQRGCGLIERGPVAVRIQAVEYLSFRDLRSLGKKTLLDNAVHLRAYIGLERGFHPPGEFLPDLNIAGSNRDIADLGQRHDPVLFAFLLTAAKHCKRQKYYYYAFVAHMFVSCKSCRECITKPERTAAGGG